MDLTAQFELYEPRPETEMEKLQMVMEQAWNEMICTLHGHDLVDVSTAGPDSGNMDHECRRCGRYWSVQLY